MTEVKTDYGDLEKQRKAWERLENNLKKVINLPWEKFGNIDGAKIPQSLDLVHILHRDIYEYPYLSVKSTGENKRIKRPSLHLNNGQNTVSIFYGRVNKKAEKTDDGEDKEVVTLKSSKSIPRFVNVILDYLFGKIALHHGYLYDISTSQFKRLSEMDIAHEYKLGKRSDFTASEVVEIISFIDEQISLKPLKEIKTSIIACHDFQMDLHQKIILKNCSIKDNECYFKVFDCQLSEVIEMSILNANYLGMVIDDADSLHNAQLQPIYQMLVACREITKTRFFVSKSGTRTGKGLRHKVISSIFDTKHVNLDELSNKATAAMAWAGFDGGEMLLVTESGEIGKSLERYLKILATESTYRGRGIGQNYADINLTGVLSIDSNEKVLFSSEMNSRAVNIAFKNRPKGETDSERESIFAPYWEAFTEQRVSETSREATALAGVAALYSSFVYWRQNKFKFNFKQVEMDNFSSDHFDFDDVQIYIIEEHIKGNKTIIKTDEVQKLLKETYYGAGSPKRKKEALDIIGYFETIRTFPTFEGKRKSFRVIAIGNPQRASKAVAAFLESMYEPP
ncbi:hypothetical protein NGL45_10070 [Lactococcus lactis]|uniref:hypothetical protein n=1 Tax=Lactococcus lactis TaxID=1358 RepID=UPI0038CFF7DA